MKTENKEIRICTRHDEEVPLIWTFAFNGSEYWCPACGFNGGMFGSGKKVELTPELKKSAKIWEKKAKEFLNAKSMLVCYSMQIDGVEVMRKDIPKELMEKSRKIVESWEYQIKH